MILTRGADLSRRQAQADAAVASASERAHSGSGGSISGGGEESELKGVLRSAEELLVDASPAMRGLGVRRLIVALRAPQEERAGLGWARAKVKASPEDLQLALSRLVRLLTDTESFVYLSVMHAIGGLLDQDRPRFYPVLLAYFADAQSPLALRAKVGEALVYAIRRAGTAAPRYVPEVMAVALRTVRGTAPSASLSGSEAEEEEEEEEKGQAGPTASVVAAERTLLLQVRTQCSSPITHLHRDLFRNSRCPSVATHYSPCRLTRLV